MPENFLDRADKYVRYATIAGILLVACATGYRLYDESFGKRLGLIPEIKQSTTRTSDDAGVYKSMQEADKAATRESEGKLNSIVEEK